MTNATSNRPVIAGITTFGAATIVIADMVGVGVFTSLGFQVQTITSGFALLALWIVGGVVAFCGATCYAELAGMFPRSSGEYNFLHRTYHPALGFLAGWLSATVGFAAPVALAAMAFGEYFKSILPGASPLLLGLAVVWAVTAFHFSGVRYGSALQVITTVIKLVLIIAFIVAGFALGKSQGVSFVPKSIDFWQIMTGAFAVNLAFVMYAYSGWNASTYIIGELHDAPRTLPRAQFIGVFVVALLYVGLNAVFLYTTPMNAMAGQIQVGMIAGDYIFGHSRANIVGALICAGLVSSISAMMWIGPRVTMTMGEDFALLRIFAYRSKSGAPSFAIGFQLVIASLLLLTQSFEAVLDFIQFSLALCAFCAVAGVLKLRITAPDLPRPYRAWGYPFTPLIFLGVTGFMMAYLASNRPLESLAGFTVMLAGLIVYWIAQSAPATAAVQKIGITE